MKLFYSPTSPYVRKVMVLITETGLSGIDLTPASGTPVAPDSGVIARNPLGKIPALEREGAPTLYDSRVICQFLNAQAGARLYPEAPRLWETLTLEATADGILDAALLMVYETRIRPEDCRHAPWVEGQWSKIARALDDLENRWMDYLTAGPLDMGKIALGCALGYLDFRHAGRHWRMGRPLLAAWEAELAARPSMQATLPKG
ncbi:glutathione S-transferase [Pseudotabrizicola algicola]|uniref:Glutathione S-transferase n=1 Tax=Pseudotabrizicola algicola TaxID=2709381 RepID=A0A6B3RPG2_9RHOB|nr:glutathione S-transferase [Pseudotabrizicola algicola]NEX47990.1 glutathione S-transferase [Pseudotabrizicola algicola]